MFTGDLRRSSIPIELEVYVNGTVQTLNHQTPTSNQCLFKSRWKVNYLVGCSLTNGTIK